MHRPVTRNADTFAYNRRGEVASATVAGRSAVYDYDFIGNFTSVAEGDAVTAYGANALNQYETVAGPDATFEPTFGSVAGRSKLDRLGRAKLDSCDCGIGR